MIYTEDSKSNNWVEEIIELHRMLSQIVCKVELCISEQTNQKIDNLRQLYFKTLKLALDGLKFNMESLITANLTKNYDKNNKIIYLNFKK